MPVGLTDHSLETSEYFMSLSRLIAEKTSLTFTEARELPFRQFAQLARELIKNKKFKS